jgi:hypothetical protein
MILFDNGKLRLIAKGNEFQLGKPTKDKEGKDALQNPKYFYDIENAVLRTARLVANTSKSDAENLLGWLQIYKETTSQIISRIEEIGQHRPF